MLIWAVEKRLRVFCGCTRCMWARIMINRIWSANSMRSAKKYSLEISVRIICWFWWRSTARRAESTKESIKNTWGNSSCPKKIPHSNLQSKVCRFCSTARLRILRWLGSCLNISKKICSLIGLISRRCWNCTICATIWASKASNTSCTGLLFVIWMNAVGSMRATALWLAPWRST